ncbi:hypothetical protein BDZ31_002614 [Conexibacter arvalis]|uniref:Uncharacterized protein n=1 Tax=Conexibacter arvalis TaxID=912552 RepID=A0A840IFC1_9ACTN|nr:hypothetical protein [Conexibacter arvalis]
MPHTEIISIRRDRLMLSIAAIDALAAVLALITR